MIERKCLISRRPSHWHQPSEAEDVAIVSDFLKIPVDEAEGLLS